MALSPIVIATMQSAVINAVSNIVAQAITAQRSHHPLVIDWVPVLQFFVWGCVNTPPNFMWQDFLESTFPAYHLQPTQAAITSASAGNDTELDKEADEGRLVEPRLNKTNTAIKTLLDQTVGAAVNTLLFSMFMGGVTAAMAHRASQGFAGPEKGVAFLLSGKALRYESVDWTRVWVRAKGDFWGILKAGWVFWPFVSIVNFVFLTTVEARNLVGSLAGLGWGVYMSLFAAK